MSDGLNRAAGLGRWGEAGLGLICVGSGLVAVGHELLWTRRLLDLLGGSADAAAVTFGTFVLGTALGAGLAAALLGRGRVIRPWRAAAVCQAACGVLALPVLFSLPLSDGLWPWLGPERVAQASGVVVRAGLAASLVLLPSLACGAFLPFLVAGVCSPRRPMARWGSWYYGINTLGGAVGVGLVPLWLAPRLGLLDCGLLLCGGNLVLAGAVWVIGGKLPAGEVVRKGGIPALTLRRALAGVRQGLPWFGSGALVLALEVLAFQQVSQVTASSQHTTVVVLGTVLVGLALGSLLARGLRQWGAALRVCLLATTVLVLVEPVLFCWLTQDLTPLPLREGAWAYARGALRLALVGLLPLFVVAGALFPLLFSRTAVARDDSRGRFWGVVLLANGFGALFGSLLAQGVLMPWAGPWFGMGVLGAGCAAVLTWALWVRRSWIWLGLVFLGFLYAAPRVEGYGGLALFRAPGPGLTPRRILHDRDGIGVLLEAANGQRRILLNNSYGVGGSHSQRLDRVQMLLPLVLHEAPRRVAALGLGAGFTAEAALLDPRVERLDALEISPLVLTLCRDGFPRDRGGLFTDPRSRVYLTDGRVFLAAQRQAYDIILGDLFVPWREGLAGLYGLEYFRQVRAALDEGGLFCQWVPLYQVRREDFMLVARTFLAVFPEAYLVRNSFSVRNPAVALVGRKGGGAVLSELTVERRCAEVRRDGVLKNALVRHAEGVMMHFIGPVTALLTEADAKGGVNTLDNATLGYRSAAAILEPEWEAWVGKRWQETVGRALAGGGLGRTGTAAAQHWVDAQCAGLGGDQEAVHRHVTSALAALPAAVVNDPEFSWNDLLMDVPLPIPKSFQTGGGAGRDR